MRLEGRTAIVTGAASGMGQAASRLFAEEGARVLAVDLPGTGLAEAHAGIDGIVTLDQDIAADSAAERIVATAIERFGHLDILMNNAGTGSNLLAEVMPVEEWDRVMGVNLRAMFLLSQRAIPELRNSAKGRIINVASTMAIQTDYGLSAYTASKHGVVGLTKTLALELGKFGITANAILPGPIYTGMTRNGFDQEHIRSVWERKTALRRLGQPIDIARAALFLASGDSDYVTGHSLAVDGGLLLRP